MHILVVLEKKLCLLHFLCTIGVNKFRRRLRRQSASSRMLQQQQEPVEDLFELEDITKQIVDDPNAPLHSCSANAEKDGSGVVGQASNRTSIGRPLRKAAEKVQSYKEIPINIKMRRAD